MLVVQQNGTVSDILSATFDPKLSVASMVSPKVSASHVAVASTILKRNLFVSITRNVL